MEVFLLIIILFWMGAIYYSLRNGIGEIVKGLISIDDRLRELIDSNQKA